MTILLIKLIKIYQRTFSPDHGWFKVRYPYGFCRFYPSCSEYTLQAVKNHGAIKGLGLGCLRILKCNPFVRPKVDLVPKKVTN